MYGPEGDRVMATRGSNKVEYFYGPDGSLTSTWLNGVVKKANVNTVLGKVASYVSGSLQYEFHDWNGSSRVVTDSSGNVISRYNSGAFGETSVGQSDTIQTNGLEWDADAQAAHAGARDYYPTFGSWNAPDPYDGSYNPYDPQSFNRYAYVGNSPVSFNDPSGLARWNNISAEEGTGGNGIGFSADGAGAPGKGDGALPTAECRPKGLCRLIHGTVNGLRTGVGWLGVMPVDLEHGTAVLFGYTQTAHVPSLHIRVLLGLVVV